MQISPGSPSGTSRPSSSRIAISVDGNGRPIVPVYSVAVDRIAGGAGRGFRKPVAFDDRHAGHLVPALGHGLLHRHATTVRRDQLGEVELGEIRVVEQRVVQRVDGRKHVDLDAFELLDHAGDIARIRNQHAQTARAHGQEAAHREREDVIQRQRHDAHELIDIRPFLACRIEPRLGLQHVGDHVAVQQRRALGNAGRAAGVLQERDVVGRLRNRLERGARTLRQHFVETNVAGKIPGRHHLLDPPHDEIDDQPFAPIRSPIVATTTCLIAVFFTTFCKVVAKFSRMTIASAPLSLS